jgi:hypothetical protein
MIVYLVSIEVRGSYVDVEQVVAAGELQGAGFRQRPASRLEDVGDVLGAEGLEGEPVSDGARHEFGGIDLGQSRDLANDQLTLNQFMGYKVLVAEDNAILALDMLGILSQPARKLSAPPATVKRALALAEQQELDCGVLDVSLKDGLVFPAAKVLRRKGVRPISYRGAS